jgi:xanthine dehydrogenase YagR molybdenum-binding subunit
MGQRRVMGKPLNRLDGIAKSTAAAKFLSDLNLDGMLFGAVVTSPNAHARVQSVDTSAAEKLPGVTTIRVVSKPNAVIHWGGAKIVFVAAQSDEIVKGAARLIKVDYEVLAHIVIEEDLAKAGDHAKPAGEQTT